MSQYEKMYMIPKSLYNVYLQSNSPIKDEMSSVYVRQLNKVNVNISNDSENGLPNDVRAIQENLNPLTSTQLASSVNDDSFRESSDERQRDVPSNVMYNNQVQAANDSFQKRYNELRPYSPTYVSSSSSPTYIPPSITNNIERESVKYGQNEASPSHINQESTEADDGLNLPMPSVSRTRGENSIPMEQETNILANRNADTQAERNMRNIDMQTDSTHNMKNANTQAGRNMRNVDMQTDNSHYARNVEMQTEKDIGRDGQMQTDSKVKLGVAKNRRIQTSNPDTKDDSSQTTYKASKKTNTEVALPDTERIGGKIMRANDAYRRARSTLRNPYRMEMQRQGTAPLKAIDYEKQKALAMQQQKEIEYQQRKALENAERQKQIEYQKIKALENAKKLKEIEHNGRKALTYDKKSLKFKDNNNNISKSKHHKTPYEIPNLKDKKKAKVVNEDRFQRFVANAHGHTGDRFDRPSTSAPNRATVEDVILEAENMETPNEAETSVDSEIDQVPKSHIFQT